MSGVIAPDDLVLHTDAAANGGSCVARHDGRVVFVRYALPGETVRARIVEQRASYWTAEVTEVLEPAPGRIDPICPIAGPGRAGCCDLAFVEPAVARRIKGAVVANQLARLGGYRWREEDEATAEPLGAGEAAGWRTRVRLATSADGRAGFHRYHSAELVHRLDCAQLPHGMLSGIADAHWPPGAAVHVAVDDDGVRHIVTAGRRGGRKTAVVEGGYEAVQRVSGRTWRIPVTAFWQAHREAPDRYSQLVAEWAGLAAGMTAWDLYGGAGVFAAALAGAVGDSGRVISVDTSRGASRAARTALADLSCVTVVNDSVRRALRTFGRGADVAVLDPPRTGAGREVIEQLSAANVPRVVHIGCEAASFARDIGLYRSQGYAVEALRVFDSFPLTHHVECVAVLTRAAQR
ncbi:23S rRNA methyltransferase [Mycolicibacterium duvalii]|uniref:23S rRNA methyltransferase n=1 Tax=Mycolicibacterium duvalii TaxID=39688 RepID=A0A7I7JZE0_9MYCO|nr:TRAM domain-containing protein [Mycolicibacterium duvalii]MCV7369762.1 class I SAM-dependent RNA methyltransferase [Mycolicibacterium duvalii]PEG43470.1 23S rRNA methyltransferase [Mycolicibacterium duvalii]BBX17247.1 23S rRNA methyltransferase [Mycolicibacterium duvalii]